ncbi:CD1107 family mobile element protein [Listeria seeligeri]|uniref:CD1107 family mobile element protein n=1 Tax=Listeria seeligeri TaxID=1640 RepID=UPI0018870C00|nr:DUF4366 domain-containing protein [Listeria seeligeri]MBF2599147.1 DUF4366 domain-containing protein [Listeria seeligeri]
MKIKLFVATLLSVLGIMNFTLPAFAQAKDEAGTTVTPTIPSSGETNASDTDVPLDENSKPAGGGSVIESNNTTGEGKTFYTITTKDEQTFYIIVDNTKASDNVYLLTDVTQDDLANLVAGEEAPIIQETPQEETTTNAETEAIPKNESEETTTNYLPIILLIGLVASGIGGGYYYLKVYKPKKDLEEAEDLEDFSFVDEVENYRNEQYPTDELEELEEEDDE